MYNEEQKLKYLETIESDGGKRYAEKMFIRFEKSEEERGDDLANWDPMDIYTTIESFGILDFGTIKQYLSTLTSYRSYIFLQQNINSVTRGIAPAKLDASNIDLYYPITTSIIPSPRQLRYELTKVIPLDQGYYICAAICFAWLGIGLDKMSLITDTAVDFNSSAIIDDPCNINIQGIDNNIMQILRMYWETDTAIRMHHAPCRVYPLLNGKFLHLMAGENSKKNIEPIKVASIKKEFSNFRKTRMAGASIAPAFEYQNLQRSGGLYRMYQLEKSGVDLFSGKSDDILVKTYAAPGKTFDIRSLYRQYKRVFELD